MDKALELPVYLFHQGTAVKAYELMGAHTASRNGREGYFFRVWAPKAAKVSVIGDFNQWEGAGFEMERITPQGIWQLFVPDIGEYSAYKYLIEDAKGNTFDNNGSIISFIYGIINGVQSKSEKYGIVESASNLGMVSTATGNFVCRVSAASTSDSKLLDITSAHEAISSMSSMTYTYKDGVPRWPESADGALLGKLSKISSELSDGKISGDMVYQKNECGWFAKKNPTLQIVSIGPMIRDANTIHETLDLDSVTKPANILMKFLATSKTAD
jgi:di/tripeptidase